jgi:GT2 family glycosyltransferase
VLACRGEANSCGMALLSFPVRQPRILSGLIQKSYTHGEKATVTDKKDIDLSIIIANYNAKDMLFGCLQSIYHHPPRCTFEVFVVDDASSDASCEMVEKNFPQVHLLHNEQNIHYSKSNNRALKLARGRYVYLLNNDTVILPNALEIMINFFDQHPEVGAVGSRLLNGDGTIQASVKALPSIRSGLFGAQSIITKLFPKNHFSRQELLHLCHDMSKPFQAGYVSGASAMICQKVIQQIGYLDERMFYHVDADYCKRIWDAGWEVYYLPDAAVVHFNHKGGTLINRRRRFKSIFEFHRGYYIYFRKHLMNSVWNPICFMIIIGLALRFTVCLIIQIVKEMRAPRQ